MVSMLTSGLLNCCLVESLCRDAKRQPRDPNILSWVLSDTFSLPVYNKANKKLRKIHDCLVLRKIASHVRETCARSWLHFEESDVLVNMHAQGNPIHAVHTSLVHVVDGKMCTIFSPPIGSTGIFITLFIFGHRQTDTQFPA